MGTLLFWKGSFYYIYNSKSMEIMNEHTQVSINEIQNSSDMFIGEGHDSKDPRNIPDLSKLRILDQIMPKVKKRRKKVQLPKVLLQLIPYGYGI